MILLLPPPGQGTATGPIPLDYVGGSTLRDVPRRGDALRWRGSHHDLAMQKPDAKTVQGDFSGRSFEHQGVVTRFYRRDGRYLVRTDGPDGRLAEFAVAYVFGVTPLEQYLLELPGGRLQALGIAWDSRPKADGGQRFFHLYPGETIDHHDVLHWTRLVAELEHAVRGVPLDEPAQGLRSSARTASDHVLRDRRLVRGVPRPRVAPRRVGAGGVRARPRAARGPGAGGALRRPPRAHRRRWTRRAGPSGWTTSPRGASRWRRCGRCHARRGLLTGGLPAGPAARPDAPAVAPRRGPLLRRRADAGRGLQLGLVPAEPHVPGRGHLLRLPRPARRAASGGARRGVRPVPQARDVRDAPPSLPPREGPRAPPASRATCAARRTWWWTSGTTTRSACRVPT